jgi:hypothetical protein
MGVYVLRTLMSLLVVKGIIDVSGLRDEFCHVLHLGNFPPITIVISSVYPTILSSKKFVHHQSPQQG